MFVLSMLIIWGADKRPVGDRQIVAGRVYSRPHSGMDRSLWLDHTTRHSGPHFVHAGSHKTLRHGIAVEEIAPFHLEAALGVGVAVVVPVYRTADGHA